MKKLVGKCRFWSKKVWKIEEVSQETLVLMLRHVSSRFSGFMSMGEAAKLSSSKVSKEVLMSFCLGGFSHVWKRVDIRSAWAASCAVACFCESQCQGCVTWWQPANSVAGVGHGKSVILRSRGSICCRSLVCGMPFCMAGAVFRTLYIPHSTHLTLHSTLYTLHSTLQAPHSVHVSLHTRHFTLHTLDSTLYTLQSTLYTSHSTLNTLHSILLLHTLHLLLHTLHLTLQNSDFTLYIPHFTIPHCTPYSLHFSRSTPLSSRSVLCTPPHSTVALVR